MKTPGARCNPRRDTRLEIKLLVLRDAEAIIRGSVVRNGETRYRLKLFALKYDAGNLLLVWGRWGHDALDINSPSVYYFCGRSWYMVFHIRCAFRMHNYEVIP